MTPVTTPTSRPDTRPIWGDGVRTLRGIHGLTQVQLAEKAKTTQGRISAVENGTRQISDALRVRIARALKADPHDLFPYLDEHGGAT